MTPHSNKSRHSRVTAGGSVTPAVASKPFTPGPWGAYNSSGFLMVGAGKDTAAQRRSWVAQVNDDHMRSNADARLIAEAPELYALVEQMLQADVDTVAWSNAARDVLAKARGEA